MDVLHPSKLPAAAAARTALDVAQKQSSLLDRTAGLGMLVGSFGLGADEMTDASDLNGLSGTQFFRVGGSTLNSPVSFGSGLHLERGAGVPTQIVFVNLTGTIWLRSHAAGAWSSWIKVYDQKNILGTVSQSGGVPTGAIVERGSNANGEYVRYADGTQMCWQTGLALTYANSLNMSHTWSFPIGFAAPAMGMSQLYFGSFSEQFRSGAVSYARNIGTGGMQVGLAAPNGTFVSTDAGLDAMQAWAIGRWY